MSNEEYRRMYLGKWKVFDCNNCEYLNMTEEEQQRFVRKYPEKPIPYHYCNKYKKRVFHNAIKKQHDPRLEPCHECTLESEEEE